MGLLTYLRKFRQKSSGPKRAQMLQPDYTCPLPAVYYIEPTNLCNLKCRFCANGIGCNNRPKGMMSLDNYKIILDKISPHAKSIYFYNMGEPFLNKYLVEMISLAAKKRDVRTYLSTNFSLPDLDHEAIVLSGLSQIHLAVDGATQETYGKYRVGGDLNLVLENVKRLQETKSRFNMKTPLIKWEFLVNKYNEHEQGKAKNMAAKLGVDIGFAPMIVYDPSWESAMHNNGASSECMKHSTYTDYHKSDRSLPRQIDNIVLHPGLIGDCKHLFYTMIINWDCEAYPCFGVYDKKASLGSALNMEIKDLWNNSAYRKCREYLFNYGKNEKTDSVCRNVNCFVNKNGGG